MITEQERQQAAEALYQAEIDRVMTDPISIAFPEAEVEDAYRIAQLVTEMKIADGREVRGQKIGLTSKAMQETVGVDEPDYGNIFDNWFVDEGSIIPMSRMNTPRVEVELAFVLNRELTGPSVNTVDVLLATDFVLPAFEIIDNRFERSKDHKVIDSIADAASCGLVILGGNPVRLTDIDIRQVSASLSKNGEIVVSGMASAVMGNPVNAVAWLARKLYEFGVTLPAGQTILSGSFVRAVPISAGDSFAADFAELGMLTIGVSND